MTETLIGGIAAARLSIHPAALVASAVVRAARQLLTDLERGRRIDAAILRGAMEATPLRLAEAIPFAAYATLRTDDREEMLSRVAWLGSDVDGVIVFDNSHANSFAIERVVEREGA
jgi:hypothetical protein